MSSGGPNKTLAQMKSKYNCLQIVHRVGLGLFLLVMPLWELVKASLIIGHFALTLELAGFPYNVSK